MRRATFARVVVGVAWSVALGACGERKSDGAPPPSAVAAESSSEVSSAVPPSTPSGQTANAPSVGDGRTLPDGRRVIGLTDPKKSLEGAPIIRITPKAIFVDAEEVDATEPIVKAGKMRKVEGVFAALKRRHDAFRAERPMGDFPGVVVIDTEEDVAALVVKAVFQTAAFAGYPNVGFVMKQPSPPAVDPAQP